MAKVKKEEDVLIKDTKKMSLIERMKAASTVTSSILGDDEFPIKRFLSTGNYMLNSLVCGDPRGGVPTGRSVLWVGEKGTGKTFICQEIIKNAQKNYNYVCQIIDTEFASNDMKTAEERGLDVNNTLWSGAETVEKCKTEILHQAELVGKNDDVIILLDSLGNTPSEKELEEGYSTEKEKRDMTRAQAARSMFRSITMPIGFKNISLQIIGHTYTSTTSFIPTQTPAGGGGPQYGASIIIMLSKSQIKEDDKVVGWLIKCKSEKNRFAKDKSECKIALNHDGGIGLYSGLLEFCVDEELLVPTTKMPKSGDVSKIKTFYFKGNEDKEIKSSQITPKFWEWFLDNGLSDALKEKFRYKSATEGIEIDDFNSSMFE